LIEWQLTRHAQLMTQLRLASSRSEQLRKGKGRKHT
jgi:hypothetical protein